MTQMPIAHWHEQIGDPTIADSILDRLVHNAYRIELKPGTYCVQMTEKGQANRGFAGPTSVTVVAGKTVMADFTYTIQLL